MKKSPLEQFRMNGVCVTDLSAQLWCEKQLEFSLIHGTAKTEEMQKGSEIHEKLEEEIIQTIPVKVLTIADRVAVKLDNMLGRCEQLMQGGITRELPIKGDISGLFIHGIIDELRIEDNQTKILDHKTRKTDRMPTQAQLRSSGFQLMLYKKLLDMIHKKQFTPKQLMDHYGFSKTSVISKELEADIRKAGLSIEGNLHKLSQKTFSTIRGLPKISNELRILYTSQKTGHQIGEHKFFFTKASFENNFSFCREFWEGKRESVPVGESNRWKCSFCEFRELCNP